MKIVHANTQPYGGACVVARRLHLAMRARGVDSHLLTRFGSAKDRTPAYAYLDSARLFTFLKQQPPQSLLYRLARYAQERRTHPNLLNRPAGHEIFSTMPAAGAALTHPLLDAADVIHLHWINHFVDSREFFRRYRGKRFVWTLHDMNPLTGGCHHADGCTRFEVDCRPCPQLAGTIDESYAAKALAYKAEALSAVPDDALTIVSPSRWLLDLSGRSVLLRRFRHELIDNPSFAVEPPVEDIVALRTSLGLPPHRRIVLFVSDNLRNPRKGLGLLFEAVLASGRAHEMHLVGVGNANEAPEGVSTTWTGTIADPNLLARYYRAADVFATPSLAENAPLVVIEALSCGTPVLASAVGGIPELLDSDAGRLVPQRTVAAWSEALCEVLFERRFERSAIAERASRRFGVSGIAERYLNLYRELLGEQRAAA